MYTYNDGKRYKCAGCKVQFTVKSRAVYEDSKIGMRKWFLAIYLLTSNKKGLSSCDLERKLKVTQKTGWFMEHRIRHAFKTESFNQSVNGVVEADETLVGGKEKYKHWDKKTPGTQGRSTKTKTLVIGFKERSSGHVQAFKIEDAKADTIHDSVTQSVAKGSILMTDEFKEYKKLSKYYDHRFTVHR